MRLFFLPRAVMLLALAAPLASVADVLQMPQESLPAAAPEMAMPVMGMHMNQVEAKFGKPREVMPPVGDPPITRWVYDGFTVYFEYSYVIQSIANR